ncbi:PepSY-associated TM helix domain-containing protein [Pedobacter sp. MR22-3]|uniref:PepSY-associated TM helix domain-containing protein n=1 Tax=Pedobacter sp. MR22-3 TaxID=2994552 RepID=UPI0022479C7C|nr:PepSY-associated TM helix domain-containing protein [Pedobacter sp. MR22-3]MCX2585337.1 PepSY-associated TM helix domain-containing protein [Pedobacter sp. MR22-3]
MDLRKRLIAIHLWIGLLSGLVVMILGLTGCILVFVDEIKPLVYADRMQVSPASGEPLSMTVMMQKAHEIWGKDKPVSALEIDNDPMQTWHFRAYRENNINVGNWYWHEKKFYESLFMNPYTGELVFHEQSEFEFFRIILYLHWSLLLKTELGQPVVGVVTLLYVISLLTGLYLWWPKNKKARRVRFWFKWKKNTGLKRRNYDLHNILGFYVMSLGLVIALTGMMWAFPMLDRGLQKVLNLSENSKKTKVAMVHPLPEKAESKGLDLIFKEIKKKYPTAKAYHFYFPAKQLSTVMVLASYDQTFKTVTNRYDVLSGQLLETSRFEDERIGERFSAMNYDIHTGNILGLPGKILAFLGSLISASLPLTGFLIWYNRKKGKST